MQKQEHPPTCQAIQLSNKEHCPFCKVKRGKQYHRCCKNCLEDISRNGHKHNCHMTRGRISVFTEEEDVPCDARVVRRCADGRIIADVKHLKSSDKYVFFDFEAMTNTEGIQTVHT